MTAIKVEFHRLADKEYEEALKYYAVRSPDTAQRFVVVVAVAHTSRRPGYWRRRK